MKLDFEVIQMNRNIEVLEAMVKSDKNCFVYSGIVYVDIVVWQVFLNKHSKLFHCHSEQITPSDCSRLPKNSNCLRIQYFNSHFLTVLYSLAGILLSQFQIVQLLSDTVFDWLPVLAGRCQEV